MTIHDNIRQSVGEHPFAQYVRILGKGKKGSRSFTREEAEQAMSMILNGEVEDIQLGAFLMLIRVKEETPDELAGFVKAVKKSLDLENIPQADLDWSSYAGKRRHLPWFIFSALLLAQMGHRVFMHGASGHTHNRIYTETIIEKLGLKTASNWSDVRNQLDSDNFSFMPLSALSQKLADLINLRGMMGLRSPVHSLTRLINPCNADAVVQGVFHPPYLQLHQKAASLLGYKSVTVLKGEGGEIERNPDNESIAHMLIDGELTEEAWPPQFNKRHTKPAQLEFADMLALWRGDYNDESAAEYAEAAIISTAAIGLKTINPLLSQDEALDKTRLAWEKRDRARF
jgi:anthranilate phosphoribosyltransferase